MNKAAQEITSILTACGCKPDANGSLIKINAPTVNDAKKDGKKQ